MAGMKTTHKMTYRKMTTMRVLHDSGLAEAILSWSSSSRLEGRKSMDAETWFTLTQFYECVVCISLFYFYFYFLFFIFIFLKVLTGHLALKNQYNTIAITGEEVGKEV